MSVSKKVGRTAWALLASVSLATIGVTNAPSASAVNGGMWVEPAPGWAAALFVGAPKLPNCSGSLIKSDWVLTAAHCVVSGMDAKSGDIYRPRDRYATQENVAWKKVKPDSVKVVLGEYNPLLGPKVAVSRVEVKSDFKHTVYFEVSADGKPTSYPCDFFDRKNSCRKVKTVANDNDAAVLQLRAGSSNNLLTLGTPLLENPMVAYGYGQDDLGEPAKGVLKRTAETPFGRVNDHPSLIGAEPTNGTIINSGDSGGPWIQQQDGFAVQIGISSASSISAGQEFANSIDSSIAWIRTKVGALPSLPPSSTWTPTTIGTLGGTSVDFAAASGNTIVGGAYLAGDTAMHGFAYDLTSKTMTDLGTLGGDWSRATAVSGNVVTGTSYTEDNTGNDHGFAYDLTSKTMTDLGTLGGAWTIPTAISENTIVGRSSVAGNTGDHAFSYDLPSKTMTDLGTLGGSMSRASAISGDYIVGDSLTNGDTSQHAFAYDLITETMTDLGTLGGSTSVASTIMGNLIVGYSSPTGDTSQHAFAYDLTSKTMTDLGTLGGTSSWAWATSGNTVVGLSDLAGDTTQHGFVYDLTTKTMTDLGTLGGSISDASAISGNLIFGSSSLAGDTTQQGFIYDLTTKTMTALPAAPGDSVSQAFAISGSNIIGVSSGATDRHVVIWTHS